MNRIRIWTSGALLLFACYCLLFDRDLPFMLPEELYILALLYFSFFPIKDMIAACNSTLYKGRQFVRHYTPDSTLEKEKLMAVKKMYDHRAIGAMVFWLIFLFVPGALYLSGRIDRCWIFFFFALSDFSVFFAIFGWCPFHSIFIRPDCCMECRIYNWDSFFQYSFLLFLPGIYTTPLLILGVLSLLKWEWAHAHHPERFYKISNLSLTCECCDLDGCRHHKKNLFHKELKEEWKIREASLHNKKNMR